MKMVSPDHLLAEIRSSLTHGTTRFRAQRTYTAIKKLVEEFRHHDPFLADFYAAATDQAFGFDTAAVTVQKCNALIKNAAASDEAVFYALCLVARLTMFVVTPLLNGRIRQCALDIARKHGWGPQIAFVYTNWTLLGLYRGDYASAARNLSRAESMLAHLPDSELEGDSLTFQLRARVEAHRAKLAVKAFVEGVARDETVLAEVKARYQTVTEMVSEFDHLRTNYEIESAEELHKLVRAGVPLALDAAEEALRLAAGSADSHICDLCRGYFHQVRAQNRSLQAELIRDWNPKDARRLWEEAKGDAENAVHFFQISRHPNRRFPQGLLDTTKEELMKLDKASQIFLSHKGQDKDLVRRYHSALKDLGFQPWIDEAELHAGTPLERGLLRGLKQSCAAVFFITPEFKDEGFLATEIDYAVAEQRERPSEFVIVTLVYSDAAGRTGTVPDLLRRFVWKQPTHDLEALLEIIRAVPVKLPDPRWP